MTGRRSKPLVEWHLAQGTHGIVPVGTTGESATLDVAEHLQVIDRTVEVVGGRVPVVAGTGANSTAEAIHLTLEAPRRGRGCLSAGHALLQPSHPGRPLSALHGHRRGDRRSAAALQRAATHRL